MRWIGSLVLLSFLSVVGGQERPPLERPRFQPQKVLERPVIDGNLNDPCWTQTEPIGPFWRTDYDELAPQQTAVRICYDDSSLYFAIRCDDPEPHLIRAQQTKRGGSFFNDDWVSVGIDPLNRPGMAVGETLYIFFANPRGTQDEIVPGGAAAKIEWRGDWNAAAKITKDGWEAEIAIPFRILRLPKKVEFLGITIYRFVPAPRGVMSSFPYRRGPAIGNSLELGPLELPEFQPPVLRMSSVSLGLGEGRETGLRLGVDAKQHLPNGLQWQLTINPDFRNVEDVVETIDFTYVPRSLPDRRPFFAEGSGYLPPSSVFYSRLMTNVWGGFKIFGKTGRTESGLLLVGETDDRQALAGRWQYDLDRKSQLQLFYSHRNKVGRSGAIGGSWTGAYPSGRHYLLIGNAFITSARDDHWSLSFAYTPQSPGRWGLALSTEQVGAAFAPSLGFQPEINYRSFFAMLTYSYRFRGGKWHTFSTNLIFRTRDFLSGPLRDRLLDKGTGIFLNAVNKAGWAFGMSAGEYERPPFKDHTYTASVGWNSFDQFRSGQLDVTWGRRANRRYLFTVLSQGVRIGARWTLRLRWEHLDHFARQDQMLLTGVYDISPEQSLVFRWVKGSVPAPGFPIRLVSADNLYFGFRQFSRKGVDVYFLIGDPNARRTQLRALIKVIRMF
ncbi:MAG: carbohydrate binding family 9 domain-containing protein [Armatimonadetes bacterium]|nr:carbohydrate binding family 9 domain-containing protein [Armatimonadota bacterium]MDW8121200.1 carbohydrate binding family 9 domain-containing protein [Armatimonadota bacterium]